MNNAELVQAFLDNQRGQLSSYEITQDYMDGLSVSLEACRGILKLTIEPSDLNIITEILECNKVYFHA